MKRALLDVGVCSLVGIVTMVLIFSNAESNTPTKNFTLGLLGVMVIFVFTLFYTSIRNWRE